VNLNRNRAQENNDTLDGGRRPGRAVAQGDARQPRKRLDPWTKVVRRRSGGLIRPRRQKLRSLRASDKGIKRVVVVASNPVGPTQQRIHIGKGKRLSTPIPDIRIFVAFHVSSPAS
jgi:hypothetical protein